MVIDFFERFQFAGGKIRQAGLSTHHLCHGFGELMKGPGSFCNDFAVIDATGLLGEHLFVLTEQKVGIAVFGFCPFWLGALWDNAATVMKDAGSQIFTGERVDVYGIEG